MELPHLSFEGKAKLSYQLTINKCLTKILKNYYFWLNRFIFSKNNIVYVKGDSFFIKSVYLILLILALSFFINRLISINVANIEIDESSKFQEAPKKIYNLLINDICLGYKENAKIDRYYANITSHKVLDKNKLDQFSEIYSSTEPECAIDNEYGYRVEVSTLPFYFESYPNDITRETVISETSEDYWSFGQEVFSEDKAFEEEITLSMPVVIFYSNDYFVPGKMNIIVSKGEIEKLSSFIDMACLTLGENYVDIYIHYPVRVFRQDNSNYLCMRFPSGEKCQKLLCNKEIEFPYIDIQGYYTLRSNTQLNKMKIIS